MLPWQLISIVLYTVNCDVANMRNLVNLGLLSHCLDFFRVL